MESGMTAVMDSLEKKNQGNIEIIKIRGRILQDDAQSVENSLQESYLNDSIKIIVVDLSAVSHICSSALGVLISMKRRIRKRDGDIKLIIRDGEVRTLIQVTMLDRVFQIYDNLEEALTGAE